jgi:putative colanic acid biosynthesis glycosyltransferase
MITIIICTLNEEANISGCLDSVLNQNYSNYQVIVKDGGSNDLTCDIVESYVTKYKKFSLIKKLDSGIYNAMNQALENRSCGWIFFMGADDRFYDNNILRVIDNFSLESIDALYGNCIYKDKIFINQFNWKMLFGNAVNHQSIFYNSRLFDDLNYSENYKYASDYKLNLYLYLNCYAVEKINFIVSFYGDKGLSNRNYSCGQLESHRIRIELLGRSLALIILMLIKIKNLLIISK